MKTISKIASLIAAFLLSILSVFAGGSHHMTGIKDHFGISKYASLMHSQYFYLLLFLAAFVFIFWLWMFIDCLKRDFKKDVDKIVWVFLLLFFHIFGAVLYNVLVKAADKKQKRKK